MRRLLFAILVMLGVAAMQLQAKTIHWLTFIDTTDGVGKPEGGVGETDQNTRKILYAHWISLVNASLGEQGYNPNIVDIYGSKTSPENCKDIINDLQCDSEDIVMFYYVGHGTENTSTSKFPLMLMAQTNVNKFVPLTWVHETLKKKGARLTISIGMCCNARQGAPGRIAPTFNKNYGNTYINQDMSKNIKKLFLNYRGDLIVTSASPAESSWACESNIGPTDYFTRNLLAYFNNILPNDDNPNWENMLAEIKKKVYEDVKNDVGIQSRYPGSTQTPIWDNHLVAASTPAQTRQTPPDKQEIRTNDLTILKTLLNKALAYISSNSADEMERIKAAKKIETAFKGNMTVRIMSQDGDVVVDKESISDYLGRISTSRLLMNVYVDDLKINQDGQIISLRVRELYKSSK